MILFLNLFKTNFVEDEREKKVRAELIHKTLHSLELSELKELREKRKLTIGLACLLHNQQNWIPVASLLKLRHKTLSLPRSHHTRRVLPRPNFLQ